MSATKPTKMVLKEHLTDFSWGSMVKSPPAKVGDADLIPGLGRFHMQQGQLSPGATAIEPML